MQLGLALPQYDYSVPGERPAASSRRSPSTRARGRARRLRLGLAVRSSVPRPREVRRPARRASVATSRSSRSRALARVVDVRLGTLVLCEALRPGGGARQGARDARPHQRRPARRRARRGLVRARVRRRSAWRCRRPGVRLARLTRGRRRRDRSARRRTVHVRRPVPPRARTRVNLPPARAAAAAARVRRRQGRPAARASSPSTPTGGTRAGRGRPTRTASGSTCSTRACERVGRDPATVWRTLGLYALVRRGRSRSRAAASSGCARSHRPGIKTLADFDEFRTGRLVGTDRAGARAGRASGKALGVDTIVLGVGAVPFQVDRPRRRRAPGCGPGR